MADLTGNVITVSNVAVPSIASATYNAPSGILTVTGAGFLKKAGPANDVDVSKFTITGDTGATYTLTATGNVEITSSVAFTITLAAADKSAINLIVNKSGTSSLGGTTYNLSATEDWAMGADPTIIVADLAGNGITVTMPTITATNLSGVTPPAAGATPVATLTPGTGYVGTVTWSPSVGTYDYSTVYTATITLNPTSGYTLNGVTANQFTVAGASVTNAANSGIVTAVFAVTNDPPVIAGLSSSDTDNEICAGETITFAGTGAGPGGTYEFFADGISLGAASSKATLATERIKNGQIITVKATNTEGYSAFSSGIVIKVIALPNISSLTGPQNVCVGSTIILASATSGGVWTSGSPEIASVSTTGLVSGLSQGTSAIWYSVTNEKGCTNKKSQTVTVSSLPIVSGITGTPVVCVGSITTLSSASGGGMWSSGSPDKAAVVATTGTVSGKEAGSTLITYTITNAMGCKSTATQTVTINPQPSVLSTIPNARCEPGTLTLGATASSGTINWYDANLGGNAIGTGTSIISPFISATTIFYAEALSTECVSAVRKAVVATVNPNPREPEILGIIQPTCAVHNASVYLNGLPASGKWVLTRSPGGTTINSSGVVIGINDITTGTYSFSVTSSEGCTSHQSANVVIDSQPAVPNAPIAKVANNVSKTSFTANWDQVVTAYGYILDIALDNSFTNMLQNYSNLQTGNTTNWNVTGLKANTDYYYRIRGNNACGLGNVSGTIMVRTAIEVPSAPIVLSASNILKDGFNANWIVSSNATGYLLEVSADAGFETFVSGYKNKDVNNLTSLSVTGLSSNSNYFYRISAYNAGGTGAKSESIAVTTMPDAPAVPVAKTTINLLQTSFSATWLASATATGYRLDVATDIGFTNLVADYNNRDAGNVTSFGISGLNPRSSYYYRVRAYNSGGTSASSNTITIRTLSLQPAAPKGLTTSSCNNLVTLKWRKSIEPYVRQYRIYGGTGNNPLTLIDSTTISISDTVKIIKELVHGLTYNFCVTAVNDDNSESIFSNQASSTVKTGLIPIVLAKWSDVLICSNVGDSISTYQWFLGNSSIAGATTQYISTNKTPGSYKVVTVDKVGCKNSSATISVVASKSLTVFPNPASVSVTLKLSGAITGRANIGMYNASGLKVLEIQTQNISEELIREIAINNLNEGVYVVQVVVGKDEVYETKMILRKQ